MPLPTLGDFKEHVNITTDDQDGELSAILDAAVDVAEGVVGALRPVDVEETHTEVNSDVLVLRRTPVDSVESVISQYAWDTAAAAYAAENYTVDAAAGLLRARSGRRFRGDVTVTYRAGSSSVSSAVRLAILVIAANLQETQRGAQSLPMQGGQDVDTDGSAAYAPGMPVRAEILLAPYARGPRVA